MRSVDSQNLERMFGDLPWAKIVAGKRASSLVQEIWRWFVVAMLAALLIEAVLCLPKAAKRKASNPLAA
jgi:branched-subunit amino acid transport protein